LIVEKYRLLFTAPQKKNILWQTTHFLQHETVKSTAPLQAVNSNKYSIRILNFENYDFTFYQLYDTLFNEVDKKYIAL